MKFWGFLLFAVLSAVVCADERPTPEAVAKAVAASRRETLAKNPPHTKESLISEQRKLISEMEMRIKECKLPNGPERGRTLKGYRDRIKAAEKTIADLSKNYAPPAAPENVPLMQLRWESLPVGTVGRIHSQQRFHCLQIREDDSILAYAVTVGGDTRPVFRWDKVNADEFVEGAAKRVGGKNMVVVGKYTYETTGGAMKTIPILEEFDPDKPFK